MHEHYEIEDGLWIEKTVEIRNWSFTVLSHLLFCFMNFMNC